MKHLQSACLNETLHFNVKAGIPHDEAIKIIKSEVDEYKLQLEDSNIKYQLLEETTEPDGSIIIKIKKQYNHLDYGDYFN